MLPEVHFQGNVSYSGKSHLEMSILFAERFEHQTIPKVCLTLYGVLYECLMKDTSTVFTELTRRKVFSLLLCVTYRAHAIKMKTRESCAFNISFDALLPFLSIIGI
jgi:hypothetical protein